MILLKLPVKTVSEANAHEHWRVRAKRAKAQRTAAMLAVSSSSILSVGVKRYATFVAPGKVESNGAYLRSLLMVTLTRIAPRELDSDNLAGSQKHVRDGVADALGINDRDPRVTWQYAQRKGAPKEYAVEVQIEEVAGPKLEKKCA